ncbi:DUF4345 family protein [Planktotalea sp.]|uniref:DUF4345 family protein n=1 Tax=Planktotalea sp. TaxID=2029877 RepID=UPI0025EE6AC8|nr:DUF4345 family protein [Planktotalea sp.]
MIDILNILVALMTIAFGAFGFLAPRFTASALDLKIGDTNMGLSEMRASVGGLFVAIGLFAIWTGLPMAYAMIGVAYAGAATGRLISIVIDKLPFKKAMLYFSLEAGPAAYLLLANL